MEDTNSQQEPKGSRRDASQIGVVRVTYNPGLDAQDRLRRLFTLVVKVATQDGLRQSQPSPSADNGSDPSDGGLG